MWLGLILRVLCKTACKRVEYYHTPDKDINMILFENIYQAALLMEVLQAVVSGRIDEGDYAILILSTPIELPEA